MEASEVNELLKLTGWADEYLAVECGVSQKTIYRWRLRGCHRKGQTRILRRLLERARKESKGAA